MNPEYIADTMAVVLRLEKRKLPGKVKNIFIAAENDQTIIYIPAITFAEIAYLSEKKRIDISLEEVKLFLQKYSFIKEKSITFNIIMHTFQITDIPELHDRIIAGCAKELELLLITDDPVIQNSTFVSTIWDD
jgi:PIN domain nuclease of toxin-antitoxin system